jgi:hypothetical protein
MNGSIDPRRTTAAAATSAEQAKPAPIAHGSSARAQQAAAAARQGDGLNELLPIQVSADQLPLQVPPDRQALAQSMAASFQGVGLAQIGAAATGGAGGGVDGGGSADAEGEMLTAVLSDLSDTFKAGRGGGRGYGEYGRGADGRGRGVFGGRGAAGRGTAPDRPPPPGYVCHRCGVPGHFIQQCTGDKLEPGTEVKIHRAPVGIPRAFLQAVDAAAPGALLLPDNTFARMIPQEHQFEEATHKAPGGGVAVPVELICPAPGCGRMYTDPVSARPRPLLLLAVRARSCAHELALALRCVGWRRVDRSGRAEDWAPLSWMGRRDAHLSLPMRARTVPRLCSLAALPSPPIPSPPSTRPAFPARRWC